MLIKTVLIKVGPQPNPGNKFMTEDACRSVIERFKKNPELLVTIGNTKNVIGKVIDLEYKDECVVGTIEVNIVFNCGGRVIQELQVPNGSRIIDCDIVGISMLLFPLGGQNESNRERENGSKEIVQ
jgi:hypothetical protein